jgi:hypothetical protein
VVTVVYGKSLRLTPSTHLRLHTQVFTKSGRSYHTRAPSDSRRPRNKRILDIVDVDTPPWERQGTGFWLDVPERILALMRSKGLRPAEAIHSACHAWMNQFALAAELRTECKAAEKEYKVVASKRKRPARYGGMERAVLISLTVTWVGLCFTTRAARAVPRYKGSITVGSVARLFHDVTGGGDHTHIQLLRFCVKPTMSSRAVHARTAVLIVSPRSFSCLDVTSRSRARRL